MVGVTEVPHDRPKFGACYVARGVGVLNYSLIKSDKELGLRCRISLEMVSLSDCRTSIHCKISTHDERLASVKQHHTADRSRFQNVLN